MSSKDLRCSSGVACLNVWRRQKGVRGSEKRPGPGQRGDWDYHKAGGTQHFWRGQSLCSSTLLKPFWNAGPEVKASRLSREVRNPDFYYVPSPEFFLMMATNSNSSKTLCRPNKTCMWAEFNSRSSKLESSDLVSEVNHTCMKSLI